MPKRDEGGKWFVKFGRAGTQLRPLPQLPIWGIEIREEGRNSAVLTTTCTAEDPRTTDAYATCERVVRLWNA